MDLMLWLIRFIRHALYVGANAGVFSFSFSCVSPAPPAVQDPIAIQRLAFVILV